MRILVFIHYFGRFTDYHGMKENDEKTAMDFWGRIENILMQKNVSLKAICKKHNIPYQTTLNQKSSAHLPNLRSACMIAMELECSVEWLLFGNNPNSNMETCIQLSQAVFRDKRLFAITNKLTTMSQEELYSLEVLLRIRN